MHIPDGVLDAKTAAVAGAVAAAGLAYSVGRLRGQLRDRTTVLMGITSACVFAAQMVNFHILVLPVSGHLLGGVLAAVMLGPWAGACVIATVLFVQCLFHGDGGLTALGANFVNMGLIGSVVGYAIYAPIRRAIGGDRGVVLGAMVAAWFSVILGSAAFAVELAASGRGADFFWVLAWMTMIHAAIGVGEALITGLVVRSVLRVRPDLIHEAEAEGSPARRWGQVGAAGLAVALAVVTFLAPLASQYDDGLEAVGKRFRFLDTQDAPAPVVRPLLPDYAIPGLHTWEPLATAGAGAIGTLVVFGVGLALASSVARGERRGLPGVAADAA